MKKELQQLMRDLEAAGGTLSIPEDAPDEVTEAFLEMVMDCPDCRREIEQAKRRAGRRDH
jgi:hypothetical protein